MNSLNFDIPETHYLIGGADGTLIRRFMLATTYIVGGATLEVSDDASRVIVAGIGRDQRSLLRRTAKALGVELRIIRTAPTGLEVYLPKLKNPTKTGRRTILFGQARGGRIRRLEASFGSAVRVNRTGTWLNDKGVLFEDENEVLSFDHVTLTDSEIAAVVRREVLAPSSCDQTSIYVARDGKAGFVVR